MRHRQRVEILACALCVRETPEAWDRMLEGCTREESESLDDAYRRLIDWGRSGAEAALFASKSQTRPLLVVQTDARAAVWTACQIALRAWYAAVTLSGREADLAAKAAGEALLEVRRLGIQLDIPSEVWDATLWDAFRAAEREAARG